MESEIDYDQGNDKNWEPHGADQDQNNTFLHSSDSFRAKHGATREDKINRTLSTPTFPFYPNERPTPKDLYFLVGISPLASCRL